MFFYRLIILQKPYNENLEGMYSKNTTYQIISTLCNGHCYQPSENCFLGTISTILGLILRAFFYILYLILILTSFPAFVTVYKPPRDRCRRRGRYIFTYILAFLIVVQIIFPRGKRIRINALTSCILLQMFISNINIIFLKAYRDHRFKGKAISGFKQKVLRFCCCYKPFQYSGYKSVG